MKKLVSLLLALVMSLGLFSAALAEGNAQVFWYTFSDVYLSSVRTSLDAALTDKGIAFVDQNAGATQATQTDQIGTAIASSSKKHLPMYLTLGRISPPENSMMG